MIPLLVAALVVVVGAVCVLALLAITPTEDGVPTGSDIPREELVRGWPQAARLARTDTFEPAYLPNGTGEPTLTVRGVPGDSSRPVSAAYGSGLVVRQAHIDVDPQLEDESAEVDGADDAWWGTVQETTHLYVRRGETLVILSGVPEDELIRTAVSLDRVEQGR